LNAESADSKMGRLADYMILVIDNYDSFTYNLVQYLGELGTQPLVRRNDEITVDEIAERHPERIVISPGPGRPEQAGITLDVIRTFGPTTPLLGVCLGHQAIGMAFGGSVVRANAPMHGKTSSISHDGQGVFAGVASPLTVARYHSLVVDRTTWPGELEIAAETEDDATVMALRHRRYPIHGVQFHPESIMTREGRHLLRNFLAL
jgi:anthranilate synthase/aminodeoxychorismate synthase-like glutamine amidotransferase